MLFGWRGGSSPKMRRLVSNIRSSAETTSATGTEQPFRESIDIPAITAVIWEHTTLPNLLILTGILTLLISGLSSRYATREKRRKWGRRASHDAITEAKDTAKGLRKWAYGIMGAGTLFKLVSFPDIAEAISRMSPEAITTTGIITLLTITSVWSFWRSGSNKRYVTTTLREGQNGHRLEAHHDIPPAITQAQGDAKSNLRWAIGLAAGAILATMVMVLNTKHEPALQDKGLTPRTTSTTTTT